MNKYGNNPLITRQACTILLLTILIAARVQAQTAAAQTLTSRTDSARALSRVPPLSMPSSFGLLPSTTARTKTASGLKAGLMPMAGPNFQVVGSGTLGRLTKWTGFTSNSLIGDSTIFEDKFGMVGIGTDSPTSKLTVAGMIQSLSGGIKFPDGTVQTTAGLGSIFLDATLRGNGTLGSPFGVAIPLNLTGSAISNNVLTVVNTAEFSDGVSSFGGPSGGRGVVGFGGSGNSSPGGDGVVGEAGFSNNFEGGRGLVGFGGSSHSSNGGFGVEAFGGDSATSSGGTGVRGAGGVGDSNTGGRGVLAEGGLGSGAGNSGGIGIEATGGFGINGATTGLAGHFNGDVQVTGNLSKGGGSFKIDHPLDPENKYLYHSFVESPDMMNIYNGNVTTDETGDVTVELPEYFESLNRDFRYQLTVIGTFAQVIVAEKIKGNHFRIKTNAPNVEVSWQVTGIRHDAYANKNRIKVEEDKPERERGFYLHPEAFGQPEERSIGSARHPEMRRMKETLSNQIEELKQK
jgi:hypothetical protein